MSRPDPLSPEMASLLAKERAVPPASAVLRARVMARARAAVRSTPTSITSSFWRRRAVLLAAAALVMAFGALAIAGFRSLGRVGQTSVPSHAITSHRASARVPEPRVDPAESGPLRSTNEARPSSSVREAAPAPRRSSPGDTYALELAILQRARALLASGKFSAALDATAEHQRRFPNGNLREEREALRVKALAGAGRNDEARTTAEQFRRQYPGSVLSPQLEATARPAP